MMSPRLISLCGRNGSDAPGAKMNLLTSRWSPIVMVFCIEPVGTLTAYTIKVIPNSAMMTVTTADSKYSRKTDFGGPFGLVSVSVGFPWPLRLKNEKGPAFLVSAGVSVTLVRLLFIQKHPR